LADTVAEPFWTRVMINRVPESDMNKWRSHLQRGNKKKFKKHGI